MLGLWPAFIYFSNSLALIITSKSVFVFQMLIQPCTQVMVAEIKMRVLSQETEQVIFLVLGVGESWEVHVLSL